MSPQPFDTGFFPPKITVVVAGSFDGTTTYRLEPHDMRDTPIFRLTRSQEGGYAAGVRDLKLQGAELETLVGLVQAAQLPLLAEGALGCDGTTYTLTIEAGMVSGTWRWWNSPPDGWSVLAEVVREIVRLSSTRREVIDDTESTPP